MRLRKFHEQKETYRLDRSNPLLQQEGIPLDYVPSWINQAEQIWTEAEIEAEETPIDTLPLNVYVRLPIIRPEVFNIFVHWLYTQNLSLTALAALATNMYMCLSMPCRKS